MKHFFACLLIQGVVLTAGNFSSFAGDDNLEELSSHFPKKSASNEKHEATWENFTNSFENCISEHPEILGSAESQQQEALKIYRKRFKNFWTAWSDYKYAKKPARKNELFAPQQNQKAFLTFFYALHEFFTAAVECGLKGTIYGSNYQNDATDWQCQEDLPQEAARATQTEHEKFYAFRDLTWRFISSIYTEYMEKYQEITRHTVGENGDVLRYRLKLQTEDLFFFAYKTDKVFMIIPLLNDKSIDGTYFEVGSSYRRGFEKGFGLDHIMFRFQEGSPVVLKKNAIYVAIHEQRKEVIFRPYNGRKFHLELKMAIPFPVSDSFQKFAEFISSFSKAVDKRAQKKAFNQEDFRKKPILMHGEFACDENSKKRALDLAKFILKDSPQGVSLLILPNTPAEEAEVLHLCVLSELENARKAEEEKKTYEVSALLAPLLEAPCSPTPEGSSGPPSPVEQLEKLSYQTEAALIDAKIREEQEERRQMVVNGTHEPQQNKHSKKSQQTQKALKGSKNQKQPQHKNATSQASSTVLKVPGELADEDKKRITSNVKKMRDQITAGQTSKWKKFCTVLKRLSELSKDLGRKIAFRQGTGSHVQLSFSSENGVQNTTVARPHGSDGQVAGEAQGFATRICDELLTMLSQTPSAKENGA